MLRTDYFFVTIALTAQKPLLLLRIRNYRSIRPLKFSSAVEIEIIILFYTALENFKAIGRVYRHVRVCTDRVTSYLKMRLQVTSRTKYIRTYVILSSVVASTVHQDGDIHHEKQKSNEHGK